MSDKIVLVTDAKSGRPTSIEEIFRSQEFEYQVINSNEISETETGEILILDRCRLIVPESYWRNFNVRMNLHPSLLPLHRGAHPIFWATLFGDEVGVTAHTLKREVDKGEIYEQVKLVYNENMSFRQVHALTRVATETMIIEILKKIKNKELSKVQPAWSNKHHHLNSFSNEQLAKLKDGWDTEIKVARLMLANEIKNYMRKIKKIQTK